MNNEEQRQETRPPRRGRGPGRGMAPGEKAKDFKGSFSKLLRYIGNSKIAILITNKMKWFKSASKSGTVLAEKTLLKVSRIIPPIVFLSLIPFAFSSESKIPNIIIRIALIYLIITIILAINGILNFLWKKYDEVSNTHNHPLKGLPQIAKGLIWLIGIIIII